MRLNSWLEFMFILHRDGLPVAVLHGVEKRRTSVCKRLEGEEERQKLSDEVKQSILVLSSMTLVTCESETTDFLWKKTKLGV